MAIIRVIFIFALTIFLSLSPAKTFSQEKNLFGFSIKEEKSGSEGFRTSVGVCYEKQFNKHNSIEIGLNYRTVIDNNYIIFVSFGANSVAIIRYSFKEKFLSLPLVYTYRSKVINISAGPSLDIYSGGEEQSYTTTPRTSYTPADRPHKFDNKHLWGAITRISKTFNVSKSVVIEPGIYFNPIFTLYSIYSNYAYQHRQFYGIALSVKYGF